MAVGKIEPFDENKDKWSSYVDRLEQYFVVNSVDETKKVATLITLIGGPTYELLVTLCSPKKPHELKYDDINKIMLQHLQPTPSKLAERYKFRQRTQTKSESISDYVAALKKLARTCDFKTGLDENLRDQLVCGLFSETIRQRLFAEDDIKLSKAYKLATALEAAETNAAAVMNGKRPNDDGAVECHAVTSETHRSEGRRAAAASGERARGRYGDGAAGGSGAPGAAGTSGTGQWRGSG
ncbi:uncharacterized protein LOC134751279 [Cydia strobilella]|uniref:uncharacterized protein LOC134751279 n=1 Tax=Cydia strobilella TaxID=1100964 RepID=UPI003005820D